MKTTDYVTATKAYKGFYPTPPELVEKLLEGINWGLVGTILEPSAGKGDLVMAVARELELHAPLYQRGDRGKDFDCVEIDPYLRSILQYEFGGERVREILVRCRELEDKQHYDYNLGKNVGLTDSERAEYKSLEQEERLRRAIAFHMVHDDFLTFDSRKHYDLIVMNPPFSDGDAHLLKAISLQERGGGKIRCILNAETILNPYTNRRQVLRSKLEELNAEVEFAENAFSDAERQTDVTVALVKIDIPVPKHESSIYERLKKAANIQDEPEDVQDVVVIDFFEQIVSHFNVEVDAGLELIREYNALCPYITESVNPAEPGKSTNLTLCVGDPWGSRYYSLNANDYLRLTRKKYWEALFNNKKFTGKLTSNLQDKYRGMVNEMQDYDFTLFNIQQIAAQMNAEMGKGVQDTIIALFDKMTKEYSWYPECSKNIHYYNGWKTNKVHKINDKVILPNNGAFATNYRGERQFDERRAEEIISDIEKVFNYLDGNMTAPVDLHHVIEIARETGRTNNLHCKFFDVTFYKKGTMHIKFRDAALVDKFNIYCAKKKNWLPPNYGKARYDDMNSEEKGVVDSFHGDGSENAGRAAYEAVLTRSSYYLAEPTQELPALMPA